jgi:hypothetical protein
MLSVLFLLCVFKNCLIFKYTNSDTYLAAVVMDAEFALVFFALEHSG